MRILPKGDTVDESVQGDLMPAHVDKIVMAADHARRGHNDHVRQIVSLAQWKLLHRFFLQSRGTGRISVSD